MTHTAAITEAITTLQDAENRFGFVRVEDEQFLREWYEGLSEITEAEKPLSMLCGAGIFITVPEVIY